MLRAILLPALAGLMSLWVSASLAQEVHTGKGGPLNFDLGYGTMTNPGSSLSQTWYTVSDPALPASIKPTSFNGVEVLLLDRGYIYRSAMSLKVTAPIVAVEIVNIPFDVFNSPGRPLSLTHVSDMLPGSVQVDGQWSVYSETAALSTLTTFAYVDRVRLANGTVLASNRDLVLEEARKISAGVVISDISPAPPKDSD